MESQQGLLDLVDAQAVEAESEAEAEERWLPVPGWPGYDVSDWGRVRSWWTHVGKAHRGGLVIGPTPRILKPSEFWNKRLYLTLSRDRSRDRQVFQVHTLVLVSFVGPCPPNHEACHDPDPNPQNNHLTNLRWGTKLENAADRIKHGYLPNLKLKPEDIPEIWTRIVAGESCRSIAPAFGVCAGNIQMIRERRSWAHITKDLPGEPPQKRSLLRAADIPVIWSRLVAGEAGRAIASDYGVHEQEISAIRVGRLWSDLTSRLPGKPPLRRPSLSAAELDRLFASHGSWTKVAEVLGVDRDAIYSRRKYLRKTRLAV